jgi:hypothetical protein
MLRRSHLLFAAASAGALAVTSCGMEFRSDDHPFDQREKLYTYQFSDNGCDTGKRQFEKHDEYCKALIDDAANRDCAHDLRQAQWDKSCKQ